MVKIDNSLKSRMKVIIKVSVVFLFCCMWFITGYPVFSSEAATFVSDFELASSTDANLPEGAKDAAILLGNVSYFSQAPELPSALYPVIGLALGITPSVDVEITTGIQLQPGFLDTGFAALQLNWQMLGTRATAYFSAATGLGYQLVVSDTETSGLGYQHYLTWHISPIVLGTTGYKRQEKLLTMGLLYSIERHDVSFSCSVLFEKLYFR